MMPHFWNCLLYWTKYSPTLWLSFPGCKNRNSRLQLVQAVTRWTWVTQFQILIWKVLDRYVVLLSALLPGSPRIFGLVKYRCQHLGVTASVTEPSREGHADCNKEKIWICTTHKILWLRERDITDNRKQDNSLGFVRLNFLQSGTSGKVFVKQTFKHPAAMN